MKRPIMICAAAIGLAANALAATLDLSSVSSDEITVATGTKVTGTLNRACKVSIAANATVTLSDATILGVNNITNIFAGITCLGNVTLVLEGANTVRGFNEDYPGIYVPARSTLTIRGDGSLTAESNGKGAGIGGGYDISSGDIVIESGTITAIGGTQGGAGIGGSLSYGTSSFGSITITGGNVTATGGYGSAGIGGGNSGGAYGCDSIVISGGTVAAYGGDFAVGIGSGRRCTCGSIVIEGGTVTAEGNTFAPGIGSSSNWQAAYGSACSNIMIFAGITCVTATCGGGCDTPIGKVDDNICGDIIIVPELFDDHGSPTRTITAALPWDGDLAALTDDVTVADGMTLYGTLADRYKVSIAAGATVTLSNATILGVNNITNLFAGITCLGDATLVLEGANTVRGFNADYPGLYVPASSTLTIRGDGSLTAESNGYGAGIGGGASLPCGDIVIEGGTITATGGTQGGAGIGGGRTDGTCGRITIAGGNITATGGSYAAGIGCGDFRGNCAGISIIGGSIYATGGYGNIAAGIGCADESTCGDIYIGPGVTRVEATCGDRGGSPIGLGGTSSSCGDVDVDSKLNDKLSEDGLTRTITPGGYAAWAARSHVGAWYETDKNGIANVFRYAFSRPPSAGVFTLIAITFDEQGRAVVVTLPLVNTTGFTFSVVASDNADGTGNVATYPLSADGRTVITETASGSRFFRLRAED